MISSIAYLLISGYIVSIPAKTTAAKTPKITFLLNGFIYENIFNHTFISNLES